MVCGGGWRGVRRVGSPQVPSLPPSASPILEQAILSQTPSLFPICLAASSAGLGHCRCCRWQGMEASARARFDREGCIVVKGALSSQRLAQLNAVYDREIEKRLAAAQRAAPFDATPMTHDCKCESGRGGSRAQSGRHHA
eukprot:COSAG01_NODE_935_length_12642_cov_37.069361_2_plen_140_part_00